MADNPTTNQADPKTGADTTGGAHLPALEKPPKPGDQPASAVADTSGLLLDSANDPGYQAYVAMVKARQAAASEPGGAPGGAAASGGDANHQLQQKGMIPNLAVSSHELPGTALPAAGRDRQSAPVAAGDQRTVTVAAGDRAASDGAATDSGGKQRLAYLQATVENFLPVVLAPQSGPPDAALQASIAKKQEDIKQEAAHGEFGPATKEAYGQYVDWLEKTALPSTRRDLQMFQLPLDDPADKGLKAPGPDLKIDRTKVPDDQQMQRLDQAVKWAQSGDARVQVAQQALLKQVDSSFTATVKKLNLPSGWIQNIEADHARWRTSVGPLINNALSARTNLEILDELNQAGGTTAIADILPSNMNVQRDKNGKISNIHLDLPQGWDMTNPANKQRADQLSSLVAETNSLVQHTVPQLQQITGHPERALSWGDTEVSGMKGRFDASENFMGLVDKNTAAPPGEHLEDVNLVESRFDVDEKDGKLVVHQHVQAQSVPWWGYQNLIGVQNVGRPIDITRTLNPTDDVVVRTSSGFEVKQADDLSTYKNWQMFMHYGQKTLMGALDAGMIASGTIELGAAYKTARIAGVGLTGLDVLGRGTAKNILTSGGTEISERALAMQAGKGLLRTSVGMAGLLNNAGARDNSFGSAVNTARSVYFLADASYGLGTSGFRLSQRVLGNGAAASAGAGRLTLAGLDAGSQAENFYKITHGVFKASEIGYIPLVADNIVTGVQRANNDRNKHVVRAAEIVASEQTGDGQKQ